MPSRSPFFASARGRLLIFNLLVVAVTLMVSGVAALGFWHASQPLYSSAPTTCESRTAAVATLAVSRARFMLPVMSSSVCCCT